MKGPDTERSEFDKQVEAGLLSLTLDLEPQHLSIAELTQRMAAKRSDSATNEVHSIKRAVACLLSVGLLSEGGDGTIAPTPAALHFDQLPF